MVSRAQAARVLASVQLPGGGPLTPVLARVKAQLPSQPSDSPFLSRLSLPLAWVYLLSQPHAGGFCSGPVQSVGTPPANASKMWAVIVDGSSGAGYVYEGAGAGMCWPGVQPFLRHAFYQVSIPYTTARQAARRFRQTFQVPACGKLDGFITAGLTHDLAVARVATGPCDGRPTTAVQQVNGLVINRPHGPLGLICESGYDKVIGKPIDCVTLSG
jgi:hypothetical protein